MRTKKNESRPRRSKRHQATISSCWLRGSNSAATQQAQGPSRTHLEPRAWSARSYAAPSETPPHWMAITSTNFFFRVGVLISGSCRCSVSRNLSNVSQKASGDLNTFCCVKTSWHPRSDLDSGAPPRRATFQLTMNMP